MTLAQASDRIAPAELRSLFLFQALDDGKLTWLAEHGWVAEVPGGETVLVEGTPGEFVVVLLSGTLAMTRRVGNDDVEITRTDQVGVYAGATQSYLGEQAQQTYAATVHAVSDCRFFTIPAQDFATAVRDWFPMAMHLLEGLFLGMRNSQQLIGQRQQLLALGALAAGLTHELNNPAAAAVRATAALRERVEGMRHKLAMLAHAEIDPQLLTMLVDLQEEAVRKVAGAASLSPMETVDREDELGSWLEERDVPGGWDLAQILVAAGLETAFLDRVADRVPGPMLEGAVRWLSYTLETELLLHEITDAVTRISDLVAAAKQYSNMDRAPYERVDVHDGLDSTLVMLGAKIGRGISVVKDYDRSIPRVPAYVGELNQVWTNLIDNAVQAMSGAGTLTVRTSQKNDQVQIEICDTGSGVPDEMRQRIFEPFFTTKAVGQGTGLGLDISYRIVVGRHGGDLAVESKPGDTRFVVRLPLTERAAQP